MKLSTFAFIPVSFLFLYSPLDAYLEARPARVVPDALRLDLSVIREEHSKDSSTSTEIFRVRGDRVFYSHSYHGRRTFPKRDRNFRLTREEYKKLLSLLRKKKLLRSVREIRPFNFIGVGVKVKLSVKLRGRRYRTVIEGMTNIWRYRGKKRRSNLRHIKHCRRILALGSFLRRLVRRHNSD